MLETDITLPDNLAFIYLSLSHLLIIFNLDNPTALSQIDHSDKGITRLKMSHEMTKSRGTIVRVTT